MAAVVASAAGTYDFVLTDVAQGVEIENWQISNEALGEVDEGRVDDLVDGGLPT